MVDLIINRTLLSVFTGFTGETCESDLNSCFKQCLNGGACVDLFSELRYGKTNTVAPLSLM